MSMTVLPSNSLTENEELRKPMRLRGEVADRHSGAFQELVARSSLQQPSPSSRNGEPPSPGDLSLLKLATSFDPMGFTQEELGVPALFGVSMGQLTSSSLLKMFAGHDLPTINPMKGAHQPSVESLLSQVEPMALPVRQVTVGADSVELGALSAQFESGRAGVASVGYDSHGGTSYGTYQISSRQGTMDRFLEFLKAHDPNIGDRLSRSGADNTGSTQGAFPSEWKNIAAENPEYFEGLQRQFIKETHYEPALAEILGRTGKDLSQCSPTVHQVLWSTAVQHGPKGAAGIFEEALKGSGSKGGGAEGAFINEGEVIDRVYALRSTKFGSSSNEVRAAVLSRFRQEKQLALSMLHDNQRVV